MKKDFTDQNSIQGITAETLFKSYFGRLSYFAFQFVNDKDIANDLVQDAFVAYWDCKNDISNHPNAIKGFLYKTVKNFALNYIKRQKVQERYFFLREEEKFEKEKALDKIIEAEVVANLHKALMQLPKSCRNVFLLAFYEGLTNPQISEKLNISVNTVRNHKQNGLKLLRSKLNLESFLVLIALLSK
ncbi:RNA polymerase sigma-70 factor (family 1) [Pedobacter sp. CG_S7]|uniref:RNA polymerase sigma-70 factor n=1 Tax=Pedobacter sp. CG_S7 TaxID=3143930 RepID=UPI00339AF1A9